MKSAPWAPSLQSPQAEPLANQPLGAPVARSQGPFGTGMVSKHPAQNTLLFPFVCVWVSVSVDSVCCTSIHPYIWIMSHEKRGLFPFFSAQVCIYLFWKRASPGGCLLRKVQSSLVPTVYTELEKGQGGAQTQSANWTLNQSSLHYKLVYKWGKKMKVPYLKVPKNIC